MRRVACLAGLEATLHFCVLPNSQTLLLHCTLKRTQQSRAVASHLQRTQVSSPAPMWLVAYNHDFSSQGPDSLLLSVDLRHEHSAHT